MISLQPAPPMPGVPTYEVNSRRSLSRGPSAAGSHGSEVTRGVYPGSGLRRVIPYILLMFVIHDGGIPFVRSYNGVDEIVTKSCSTGEYMHLRVSSSPLYTWWELGFT